MSDQRVICGTCATAVGVPIIGSELDIHILDPDQNFNTNVRQVPALQNTRKIRVFP